MPQPFKSLSAFLSKRPLISWTFCFGLIAFFWFYVLMNPWMAFQNSDAAVPFQLTIEPWRAQDLYYWGTTRMGMLFEIAWKAGLSLFGMREAVVGSTVYPELFFFSHVLIVFLSFPFWLQTLKTPLTKVLFFLFFLPLTHTGADHMLSPAQPYGIVFALNGLFFWTLFEAAESKRKQFFLGLLMGAILIQHEIAAFICAIMFCSKYFLKPRDFVDRKFIPMWIPAIVIFGIALYFKTKSLLWDPGAHYRLNSFDAFIGFIWDSIAMGSWWFNIRRGTGHVITIAAVVFLVDVIRNRRERPLTRTPYVTVFFMAIFCYALVHLARWYVVNGKTPRYFSNLIPLLIWAFLKRVETLPKWEWRKVVYVTACVVPLWSMQAVSMWLDPWDRARALQEMNSGLVDATAFCESSDSCRIREMIRIKQLAASVQEAGCAGYIDDYWNSHILVVESSGRIVASAGNHIRNPALFDQILHSRPLCVMPRPNIPFQNYVSDLDCKPVPPLGFLICQNKK